MLGNRYSNKDISRYEMISDKEARNVEITIEKLSWYKFALEAAIREQELKIQKSKESEEVKDVYRSIVKRYEDELQYIYDLMWIKPDNQMTIFDLLGDNIEK